jgi:IS5 family transposase
LHLSTVTHPGQFILPHSSKGPRGRHTLAEALEQEAILSDVSPEVAIVDRGYKGVAINGVKIYHPGLRCGITRGLRAMIRRRSAIELAIGHMKTDGKLDRNWLKGALGDAMHAVLCGASHNLRMILRKLRFFTPLCWLCCRTRSLACTACTSNDQTSSQQSQLFRADYQAASTTSAGLGVGTKPFVRTTS